MKLGDEAWTLWRSDPRATVFQSPAWLNAWLEHMGERELFLAEARDTHGRLQALLPLFAWDDGGVRKLVPVGACESDYCDMIGRVDAVPALLDAISCAPIAWDALVLPDLRPDSPLLGALPPGWTARDEPHEICPVLALPPGKGLTDILSKSQRRKVVHDRHRAEALGSVTVALAAPAYVPQALDALFDLHAARWALEEEAGALADPRIQAFHRSAAPALAEAGLLRTAVVRHEERIVAVLLGFRDAERFCSYVMGVDFSVPGQSFGTLAYACLIEAAIAEGATAFHFLRGGEPYKYRWGAQPTQTVQRTLRRA